MIECEVFFAKSLHYPGTDYFRARKRVPPCRIVSNRLDGARVHEHELRTKSFLISNKTITGVFFSPRECDYNIIIADFHRSFNAKLLFDVSRENIVIIMRRKQKKISNDYEIYSSVFGGTYTFPPEIRTSCTFEFTGIHGIRK